MSALIFIAGLAIGITAFLYIFSAITGGMKKFRQPAAEKSRPKPVKQNNVKQEIEPETVKSIGRRKVPPGARICPLCGSELTKYEGLYATKINENSQYKILIMGCKYCFKEK